MILESFFSDATQGSSHGYYDYKIVFLSYIVAVLASYVALEISRIIRQEKSRSIVGKFIAGSVAMGAGIFTMHFVGMLAFIMPMPISYDLSLTILSLIVPILASAFAFYLIKDPDLGQKKLKIILGGTIFGIAIASMHYTGMAAMNGMVIKYIPWIFALSIVIAITASWAALFLMLECEKGSIKRQRIFILSSALVMGGAICGMHYTGMAAAIMFPTQSAQEEYHILSQGTLALFIAFVATIIMVITLVATGYKKSIFSKILIGFLSTQLLLIPLAIVVNESLNKITKNIKKLNDNQNSMEIQNTIDDTKKVLLFIILVIFLLTIGVTLFITYLIARPIKKLNDLAKNVAAGDLKDKATIYSNDEIGELAGSFNVMLDSIVQLNKKKDAFLAMAAHDIRNPLFAIIEASSILKDEIGDTVKKEQRSLIDIIGTSSNSLINLLNELLLINSMNEKEFSIKPTQVNMVNFCQGLFEFNKLIARKKDIDLQLELQIRSEFGYFDPDKISQVINNFLTNAFKFSHRGNSVKLRFKEDKKILRVEVEDEAGGIPAKEQKLIFVPFAKISVKPTEKESTHGLGLAISRDLIKAHGGNIGFKSEEGKGSLFYIEISIDEHQFKNNVQKKENKIELVPPKSRAGQLY